MDNQNVFEIGDKALYDTKHLHKQTGLAQFISNISSVLGRENAWIKLKGIDKLILMTTELTVKVEDPQLKAILFLTDLHSSQTAEGEEEEILKTVYNAIQHKQITAQNQNEKIKKLLTMIYDKMIIFF